MSSGIYRCNTVKADYNSGSYRKMEVKDPTQNALATYFSQIGRKGGKKRGEHWATLSKEERLAALKPAHDARKKKKQPAVNE